MMTEKNMGPPGGNCTEKTKRIIMPLTADHILILLIAAVLIGTGIWYFQRYFYYTEKTVAEPGETLVISVSPDSKAGKAAAEYLGYAIEQATGMKPGIHAEADTSAMHAVIITEDGSTEEAENTSSNPTEEPESTPLEDANTPTSWNIRIRCGAEADDSPSRKKPVFFQTLFTAANAEEAAYSIRLKKKTITIAIPEEEICFGAVKAVTDRWLQQDCGRKNGVSLSISQNMIDRQLSGLSCEITGTVRVLTQNLRYANDGEGRTVVERAERFYRLDHDYQPDLIGTQECSPQWKNLLTEDLGDDYTFFGDSRDGPGTTGGEWEGILYRKDRFTFLDGGTFWLSNTPEVPGSQLNYDGIHRICTWVLLLDNETGKTVLLSNTHLIDRRDALYQGVRAQQAEILLRYLRRGNTLVKYPGFLTGDFNGKPDEPFYSQISAWYDDSRITCISDSSTVNYSFQNYGTKQALYDYCFHSQGNVTVLDYRILDDLYGDYISDHYGILVTAVVQ